ncbi:MAG: tetratricopeptide repeat protein [Chloroflexi bacterium]|nr:tetratricopeptide repeat protein [Chloroflexota bacterium]
MSIIMVMYLRHFLRHWLYFAVTLILLVSVGCDLGATPEPIVVTATPPEAVLPSPDAGGEIRITATPELTHTPAPLPTPTLPPQDGISAADRALFNGNYTLAVALYECVLSQTDEDVQLHAAAYYGLGQAALREGLFQQAVQALSQFIDRYPTDPRVVRAHFLRGDAYLGLFNWQAAIADFEAYLELRPGVIDSYVYERIGDAYLALGNPDLALENYVAATNATRSIVPLLALRERIAASYSNQGRYDLAVEQYDAILSVAENAPYRASIEYQAGMAEIAGGQPDVGYARLQAMIQLYPETVGAYQAMRTLLNAGRPVDNWLRARISFANEDYGDAITALNTYSTEVTTLPAQAMLMLGRTYRELGNYEAAYTTFQGLMDQYPQDPLFGEAWLDQGRTLYWSGDTPSAINRYSALADERPELPQAPEALWRVAYLYENELGNYEQAMATYDILGSNYPGNAWAQEGLLDAVSLAINLGQIERATNFYTQLANTSDGENRALALLWLGRLYAEQGQTELSQQMLEGAADADPGGYYSLRARDLLSGEEPFTPPSAYQFDFDEGTALAESEQWLRSTFGIQQEGPLYPLSDTLENDPHMVRGRELWALAAYDEARQEFETLRQEYSDDPLATYQLAHYYAEIGNYRTSIEAAAALIIMSGVSTYDAPSYIARLRYPIHYADLVLPNVETYELDPLLVFSLIRQESLFQSFATSFAAAQGLMQIIPDTGQWVATQLEWPDYQNSDIYRPYINIRFGTYYLRWVLDFVDGVPYAALAGYNGGPSNARNWLDSSGADLDRFVQTIAFDETERYVIRIYQQYDVYRHLYGVEE